ncbi:unnamed protein product [Pleuronectes platessa]|uniref:Uncharacterized protein n=1 Tax=Pleuronectes platessa TaxID=8262 RepID=A0A9N7UC17_PLEPL|nr:unnamed protein product [Pleuronectes platessa]
MLTLLLPFYQCGSAISVADDLPTDPFKVRLLNLAHTLIEDLPHVQWLMGAPAHDGGVEVVGTEGLRTGVQ